MTQDGKKLKASKKELGALIEILDDYSAAIGGGHDDSMRIEWLKTVDFFLKKNSITRNFK